MPDAGHFPQFAPAYELDAWRSIRGEVAALLQARGFMATAHSPSEYELACRLGWPPEEILSYGDFAGEFLRAYSRCVKYFGNRVHGAIVSRAFGASVWSVGYDSRQECLLPLGDADIMPPSSLYNYIEKLTDWAEEPAEETPCNLEGAWEDYCDLFFRFMTL
jgi:hypothetical protein